MTVKKEATGDKQTDSCSTKLTGETLLAFNTIKTDIEESKPGIKLTASDVCRYALHFTAKSVREENLIPVTHIMDDRKQ